MNEDLPHEVEALEQLARTGDWRAMVALAKCYEQGAGISSDRVEALKWIRLAIARFSGDPRDALYDRIMEAPRLVRLASMARMLDWRDEQSVSEPTPSTKPSESGLRMLPEHERGVARMLSDAGRTTYKPLKSLAEAQACEDGAVVLEGDYGGQIYLTCPARLVRCTEAEFFLLCEDIDRQEWACQKGKGSGVYYERKPVGSRVWGGMGGGVLIDDVWCHEELVSIGLDAAIRDVIEGRASFLAIPTSEEVLEQARSGDPRAQYKLGRDYERLAWLQPAELEPAIAWLEMAAGQGHVAAQHHLALQCLRNGDGLGAVHWNTELAMQAIPHRWRVSAMQHLGRLFREGKLVPADADKAYSWYANAARLEPSVSVCLILGEMSLRGEGTPVDRKAARDWFMAAVRCGSGDGYYRIGKMIAEEAENPHAVAESFRWFRRAAVLLSREAMLEVGRRHELGIGLEACKSEALAWYQLAERNTHGRFAASNEAVERLKREMSPEEQEASIARTNELHTEVVAALRARRRKPSS